MTEPTLPAVPRPRNRREDQVPAWAKLVGRLIVSGLGWGIALWGIYDIVVTDRKNLVPPPVAHYVIVAIVIVIGLGLAGGKKTIEVIKAVTEWTRAWRSGGSSSSPPPPAPPSFPPPIT